MRRPPSTTAAAVSGFRSGLSFSSTGGCSCTGVRRTSSSSIESAGVPLAGPSIHTFGHGRGQSLKRWPVLWQFKQAPAFMQASTCSGLSLAFAASFTLSYWAWGMKPRLGSLPRPPRPRPPRPPLFPRPPRPPRLRWLRRNAAPEVTPDPPCTAASVTPATPTGEARWK